eukprot:Lankesteria_metandrocarpae@DN5486_c0_g2_i3.p1
MRSVCGTSMAMKCGLRPSGQRARLVGVGSQSSWVSKPVRVSWEGRWCDVAFCVVEEENFPALLGVQELRALGVVVRPDGMTVSTFVCANEDVQKQRAVQKATVDIATGVEDTISDEDLLLNKMKELEKNLGEGLSEAQRCEVLTLFRRWSVAWLRPQAGKLKVSTAEFEIVGRPFKDKLRPLTPAMREELEAQVLSMLKAGVLRPSKSAWGSVPVFVKKKDGGWRMAIDYRGVNKRLKSDAYPIPLVWDNLQTVVGYKYYTCLDGHWGFWNVPLAERSREVTAVLTPFGSYEFTVLPFGIKNSPSEFQRAMDLILGDLYYRGVLCYIDDIVIYSSSWEQHLQLLDEVLKRCVEAGLFLKVSKSHIAKEKVPLLGFVVGSDGIQMCDKKVEAVRKARAPTNKKELMSFLGAASYLRRFIPFFSTISKPLSDLCKEKKAWVWDHKCELAFHELKGLLADTVLLSAPRGSGIFVIVCDASSFALGAVLCQVQHGDLVIIEFAAKKFNSAELNWATREKEAYAIRWSVEHFAMYIRGMKTLVLTDHASLQWIDSSSVGKIRRWALYLEQFDLEVKCIPGKDNVVADWLSRSVGDASETELEEICVPILPLKALQQNRQFAPYVPSRNDFQNAQNNVETGEMKYLVKGSDGLLYSARSNKLFVPFSLREAILYWFHASRYGGHMGVGRMTRRMSKWVFWPNMKSDVADYVRSCPGNGINESSHRGIEAALKARALYDQLTEFGQALGDAVLAYNATPHSAVGESPSFLMF